MAGLLVLFGLVVILSPDLFRAPIVPNGDEAANSLRVFKARSFEQLLGNFSRWQFQHPGPAYFYFLAGGEFLFHDLLRLTPAPFNAQILSAMMLNLVCAAGALAIFRRHFRSPVFPALAALTLALVTYAVNSSLPNLMLVSIWPPAWLLANFLFFLAAASAVGVGDLAVLPALAAGGALLAQGHASQAPFVVLISAGACAAGFWRNRGEGDWRRLLRVNLTRVLISVAVIAVLSAPIVMEIRKHDPDNVDAILHYVRSSRRHFNTVPQAVKFCAGFLLFTPDTERWALEPLRGQLLAALGRVWVAGFWIASLALAACAFARRRALSPTAKPFVLSVLLVSLLAATMFFVWALKLTGEFFAFNGLFIYALHILNLWTLCGLWTERLPDAWSRWMVPAALVGLTALVLWNAHAFRNSYNSARKVERALALGSQIPFNGVKLSFAHDLWPLMMGAADGLARRGTPFCVASQWAFMFDPERVCRNAFDWPVLDFQFSSRPSPPAATRLVAIDRLAVDLVRSQRQVLPLKIRMNDRFDEKEGFHPPEGGFRWTMDEAHIRFRLAGPPDQRRCHLVRVTGDVYPGRPVKVQLNGVPLGNMETQGEQTAVFNAAAGVLALETDNDLTFIVPRAGPAGGDHRKLGFAFISAEISEAVACR
jgi:hypothetical protein